MTLLDLTNAAPSNSTGKNLFSPTSTAGHSARGCSRSTWSNRRCLLSKLTSVGKDRARENFSDVALECSDRCRPGKAFHSAQLGAAPGCRVTGHWGDFQRSPAPLRPGELWPVAPVRYVWLFVLLPWRERYRLPTRNVARRRMVGLLLRERPLVVDSLSRLLWPEKQPACLPIRLLLQPAVWPATGQPKLVPEPRKQRSLLYPRPGLVTVLTPW
ncbi:hypothetical protein HRbin28_01289 [bacterium HR28]|jgi:hypothetical protein|nr:hypothetical protein HRbin28_01289 [bacterium HR28]